MSESTGYKHSDSDRKLDQSVESAGESGNTSDTQHSSGLRHDSAEVRKQDDDGKDSVEGDREQHDDAEKSSEKTQRS